MVEQGLTLQSVEQQIDDLIAERTYEPYSPELEDVGVLERSLIRKSRILGVCDGLLEKVRTELSQGSRTSLPISLFTAAIIEYKDLHYTFLERGGRRRQTPNRGPNVEEVSEEEKDDLADNYEPPSEEAGTDTPASDVPQNDGEAREGDQDGKETNDSGSPDELA